MLEFMLSAPVLLAAGYVACWFTKDAAMKMALGAKAFAAKLETKAAAIKAAL